MPLGAAEPGFEKNIHEIKCKRISENTSPDANEVKIIVLNTLSGRKRIGHQRRTNPGHLIDRATILKHGKITERFNYLQDYGKLEQEISASSK